MHDSEFVRGIQAAAREARMLVNVGVHEPGDGSDRSGTGNGDGGGKVKNTLLWIDEKGVIRERYHKVHLFDMAITDGVNMRESRFVFSLEHVALGCGVL